MASRIAIYVCDTPVQAATAEATLVAQGCAVTKETVTTSIAYDGASYSDGAVDAATGKILVIGRLP